MIEPDYRHVLFKDLQNYLRRQDYLGGFTPLELAWIRQNIGAISSGELQDLVNGSIPTTYENLLQLKENSQLVGGTIYLMEDFYTIYSSNEKNSNGKYITFGKDINPSSRYTLVLLAMSTNELFSTISIISDDPNSPLWSAQYDITRKTLDDGVTTLGEITYLIDENFNQASCDFKNIVMKFDDKYYHIFSDSLGADNSNNCYDNDLRFAKNIIMVGNSNHNKILGENIYIFEPISNLIGTLNNIVLNKDIINLSNETVKHTVEYNNKWYIDYLDLETLTHLFYELSNYTYST